MRSTALKYKSFGSFNRDAVYTSEQKEFDRLRREEAERNDPCRELNKTLSGFYQRDDLDSAEFNAAEQAVDDCHLAWSTRNLQSKNPDVIVVGDMGYVLFEWVHSLINPPSSEYVSIGEGKPERMDARRFSLMLALPGYADRDHIRLTIETQVTEETRNDGSATYSEWLDWNKTKFTVHVEGRIIARGEIPITCNEKDMAIVIMRGLGATRELAELVLSQCTNIDPHTDWPLGLYARFAKLGKCHQCNRPLTDHVSKVLQVGPTCAGYIGLEHSQRMAQKITELQKSA